MSDKRTILVDICWTLFYSNTTYDFLHIKGNPLNSLIYRLFRHDLVRSRAIKRFNRLTSEEQRTQAEHFYNHYLEPRKIAEVWALLKDRDVILVSHTMPVIAQTVAEHIGAKAFYATPQKEDVLPLYSDFDIITDNLTDLPLIRRAAHATILTYNNRDRWLRRLPDTHNITFIDTNRTRY
ncbi:MAG: hypothetical protein IJ581_07765 [Paludibacteraceae bacterium]|nr:hypothetical protein [Paludibacteraceae bacterium]